MRNQSSMSWKSEADEQEEKGPQRLWFFTPRPESDVGHWISLALSLSKGQATTTGKNRIESAPWKGISRFNLPSCPQMTVLVQPVLHNGKNDCFTFANMVKQHLRALHSYLTSLHSTFSVPYGLYSSLKHEGINLISGFFLPGTLS